MKKIETNNSSQSVINNNNYWQPLQTVDADNETIVTKIKKQDIPSMTILKSKIEQVHDLCKKCNINSYAIRRISIGLKLL